MKVATNKTICGNDDSSKGLGIPCTYIPINQAHISEVEWVELRTVNFSSPTLNGA